MQRICLVAAIGLPAVGKTSLCQYLVRTEKLPFNILHFCYDNLINFSTENPTHYKEQRENLLKTLNAIILKFKNSKSLPPELQTLKIPYRIHHQYNDIVILCDDNHYYRSMRYKLFQMARELSIAYCQIFYKCNVQLASQRNSLRDVTSKVPNDVIVRMSECLEVPNFNCKWEENTLVLENFSLCEDGCNQIISYITQCLDKTVSPLEVCVSKSTITTQSKVHELDLLMRKHIKTLMSSMQGQNKEFLAKRLNDKRKDVLREFCMVMDDELKGDFDFNKYVEMLDNV